MWHELKTWPKFFAPTLIGIKPFELRVNDRQYEKWDFLVLKEWDPATKEYTGRQITRQITYILDKGSFGLPEHMVVLGIQKV